MPSRHTDFDALTILAEVCAGGNFKLEIEIERPTYTTTDPQDQRRKWSCRIVSKQTGRWLAEWPGFEDRDEMFYTAARRIANTVAANLLETERGWLEEEREEKQQALADAKAEASEREAADEKRWTEEEAAAEGEATKALDAAAEREAAAEAVGADIAETGRAGEAYNDPGTGGYLEPL